MAGGIRDAPAIRDDRLLGSFGGSNRIQIECPLRCRFATAPNDYVLRNE
jgi:hypothetical protein